MRRRNRRKFWLAVQEAAGNERGSMYPVRCHPIWGLRAIRDFEKANGFEFNPRNKLHRMMTFHAGRHRLMLSYVRELRQQLKTIA